MKRIIKFIAGVVLLFVGIATMNSVKETNLKDVGVALAMAAPVAGVGAVNPKHLRIPMERFNELKAKHGRLYVVNISIEEDEHYQFIVCRPSRSLLSAIASYQDNMEKANDLIIKNMVLDGDLDALDDGLVYAKLMEQVASIMSQGTAFLQKA